MTSDSRRHQPSVTAYGSAAPTVEADVLVVGLHSGGGSSGGSSPTGPGVRLVAGAEDLDSAADGGLATTLTMLGALGKPGEVTLVPSPEGVRAPVVAAVGLGDGEPTAETYRRAAGSVVRRLNDTAETIAFALSLSTEHLAALTEGTLLGAYRYEKYRTDRADLEPGRKRLTSVLVPADDTAAEAIRAATVVANAVNQARDWVNTAPSDLYPETFAADVEQLAAKAGTRYEVMDPAALEAGGYGGIIGVGKGSARGPRLVRLSYSPANPKKRIALIGKGITFDTGGISLKPNDGMKTMKSDMGGAAAVLAAVLAISELGLPIEVIVYAALAENMPSGEAQRPSDVLTMYGGKTVEVLNTDAEGRLVMADALARATEDHPDFMLDLATLTGACVVALGERTFGIMSNHDALPTTLWSAAREAGEEGWPLPIPEGTREKIESKVADLANVGASRFGGALTAASFLEQFVGEGIPWAHLDIAGPAFNEEGPYGYTPTGGTGAGVRTVIRFVQHVAEHPEDPMRG